MNTARPTNEDPFWEQQKRQQLQNSLLPVEPIVTKRDYGVLWVLGIAVACAVLLSMLW